MKVRWMSKLIKIDTKVLHKKSFISNLTYFLSINHLFLLQLNQNIFFFTFQKFKNLNLIIRSKIIKKLMNLLNEQLYQKNSLLKTYE